MNDIETEIQDMQKPDPCHNKLWIEALPSATYLPTMLLMEAFPSTTPSVRGQTPNSTSNLQFFQPQIQHPSLHPTSSQTPFLIPLWYNSDASTLHCSDVTFIFIISLLIDLQALSPFFPHHTTLINYSHFTFILLFIISINSIFGT